MALHLPEHHLAQTHPLSLGQTPTQFLIKKRLKDILFGPFFQEPSMGNGLAHGLKDLVEEDRFEVGTGLSQFFFIDRPGCRPLSPSPGLQIL